MQHDVLIKYFNIVNNLVGDIPGEAHLHVDTIIKKESCSLKLYGENEFLSDGNMKSTNVFSPYFKC